MLLRICVSAYLRICVYAQTYAGVSVPGWRYFPVPCRDTKPAKKGSRTPLGSFQYEPAVVVSTARLLQSTYTRKHTVTQPRCQTLYVSQSTQFPTPVGVQVSRRPGGPLCTRGRSLGSRAGGTDAAAQRRVLFAVPLPGASFCCAVLRVLRWRLRAAIYTRMVCGRAGLGGYLCALLGSRVRGCV